MDLIDRQAAIDALKEEEYPCESDYDEGYMAALDKAVWIIEKWLSSAHPDVPDTNVGDMISRAAVIDAIDVLCQEHRYRIPGKRETYSPYNEAWQDALDRAEGAIGCLPSAQPEIVRCKDCEDYQTEWETSAGLHYCAIIDTDMPPDGFCSKATRKGEQP